MLSSNWRCSSSLHVRGPSNILFVRSTLECARQSRRFGRAAESWRCAACDACYDFVMSPSPSLPKRWLDRHRTPKLRKMRRGFRRPSNILSVRSTLECARQSRRFGRAGESWRYAACDACHDFAPRFPATIKHPFRAQHFGVRAAEPPLWEGGGSVAMRCV
jgi:hypothetical protein